MKFKMLSVLELVAVFLLCVPSVECQRQPTLPFKADSFNTLLRSTIPAVPLRDGRKRVPNGRKADVKDIYLRFYSNSSKPASFRLRSMRKLLKNPSIDVNKPTVIYAHGYVELTTDRSVQTILSAYLRRGTHNVFALDWANLGFGNYVVVAMDVPAIGKETAIAILRLISKGIPVSNIHLVGHSLGAHVLAYAARYLANNGHRIQRLTGLDPAYPGYYPPILGQPISPSDAQFVDTIHTDAGAYGAPAHVGHADFWPNGGAAKQPGCQALTVLLTDEDFCSHWRSWGYWAESVLADNFVARQCTNYDDFLRGKCRGNPLVYMGINASNDLRGNFYLRTAASSPYGLGASGAE